MRTFCDACKAERVFARRAMRLQIPKPPKPKYEHPRIAKSKARCVECICMECKIPFQSVYRNRRRRYCTDRCASRYLRRISRRLKRALLRKVTVERIDPMMVYARDGWRCQRCGRAVDRRLRAPHPKSASIDHIVPLSQNGAHAYRNVQLAHRICNTKKGVKGGDQMLLLG
jgi:5-methylcytosine-specific restriction endonuclease McrA